MGASGQVQVVLYIFNTVIGLSHLCCHNVHVLYFLNNPSVIFLMQLHSISEYLDTNVYGHEHNENKKKRWNNKEIFNEIEKSKSN